MRPPFLGLVLVKVYLKIHVKVQKFLNNHLAVREKTQSRYPGEDNFYQLKSEQKRVSLRRHDPYAILMVLPFNQLPFLSSRLDLLNQLPNVRLSSLLWWDHLF
jgi:hypothetical protein